MSIFLFLCGLMALLDQNFLTFVMLCLFLATFQLSQGAVGFLYIPEVTVDAASGFATGAIGINLILVSFTFEFMINSAM